MKVTVLLALMITLLSLTPVQAETREQYVPSRPGDCINTYIVRMLVVATANGKAIGEYEGEGMRMVRVTNSPQCAIQMTRYAPDRTVRDKSFLQCLYTNPFEN